MQISRRILLACVTSAALLPFALPAQDNDAQTKARKTLEQQAKESTDQPGIQGQTPSSPATNQPALPPARKPAPKRQAPASPRTAKSPSQGQPAAAKPTTLQDALHQKIDTLTNEPAASAPAPAPLPAPAAKAAAPAITAAPEPKPTQPTPPAIAQNPSPSAPAPAQEDTSWATVPPAASGADRDALAKAREALRQKMADMNGQPGQSVAAGTRPETPTAGTTAKAEPAPAPAPNSREAAIAAAVREANRANDTRITQKETGGPQPTVPSVQVLPGLEPLPAPPLPISGSKEQRLQQILQDYKADRMSPEQYHAQRAKILAEP